MTTPPLPPDGTTPAPNAAPEATGGDSGAPDLTPHGQQWDGPLALLDTSSGDGRIISSTGGVIRPLPLPLSWQRESGEQHDDSVIVGRVLAVEVRTDPTLGAILWGTGDYADPMLNFDAQSAMAQVDEGLGLVSVDLAITAVGFADETGQPIDPGLMNPDQNVVEVAVGWQFGGATIVGFPAFADARIRNLPLAPDDVATDSPEVIPMPVDGTFDAATPEVASVSDDGTTVNLPDGTTAAVGDAIDFPDPAGGGGSLTGTISGLDSGAQTVTLTPPAADDGTQPPDVTVPVIQVKAAGQSNAVDDADAGSMENLVAAAAVRPYTRTYFEKRELDGPTPLTIDAETGQVYGHMATWGDCHVGKLAESGQCVTAPHSLIDYGGFHLQPMPMDDGTLLDIGKLTVGTGHAGPGLGYAGAVAHYDNSGAAVALVRAHEDDYGIQVTGQLIHDAPATKVEELMRSPLSGDWRARNGNLELCAALAVNVPGFQVRRQSPKIGLVPKYGQVSLVAAGMVMPDPGRTLDTIGLPSGATIRKSDFESLVAAAMDAMHKRGTVDGPSLALRKARAKFALEAV